MVFASRTGGVAGGVDESRPRQKVHKFLLFLPEALV